jgi:hypothetical protein
MDVFAVHERLVADYRAFTSGFVEVRDPRIRAHVKQELADGVQWPDPWLSLNPSFASGGTIPELVRAGPTTSASESSESRAARMTQAQLP